MVTREGSVEFAWNNETEGSVKMAAICQKGADSHLLGGFKAGPVGRAEL